MQNILLRKLHNEDIALLEKWLYLPHVSKWFNDPLDWIDEVKNRNDAFSFLHHFIVECEGKPIGFCQYYEYCNSGENWFRNTDIKGTYSIDYLIGDIEYLGKGFGKGIVQLLIDEIKVLPNALRIIVKPEQENKASCNTLLSCGFFYDAKSGIFIYNL